MSEGECNTQCSLLDQVLITLPQSHELSTYFLHKNQGMVSYYF
jgi:hypothetical protein